MALTAEASWASRYSVLSTQYPVLSCINDFMGRESILLDHSTPEAISRYSGGRGSTRLYFLEQQLMNHVNWLSLPLCMFISHRHQHPYRYLASV